MQTSEVKDHHSFERWFNQRPKESLGWEAASLSWRSAARSLPFTLIGSDKNILSHLTDVSLWPIAVARIMSLSPARAIKLVDFANSSYSATTYSAAAHSAADAAYAAAHAAAAAAESASDSAAASAANSAYAAARSAAFAAAWRIIRVDCAFIESYGWQSLIRQPLWPASVEILPLWQNQQSLLRDVLRHIPNQHVWLRWHDRVLSGQAASEEVEDLYCHPEVEELLKQPDGFELATAWIAARLAEIEARESEGGSDDEAGKPTEQTPAAYHFDAENGILSALPGSPETFDPRFAETLRSELSAKLDSLLPKVERSNADDGLATSLKRLHELLGASIDDVNDGLLLSTSRSVLAQRDAYETAEYRDKLLPDTYAAIQDVGNSLQDLMAAFPTILIIQRDVLRLALSRNRKRLEAIRDDLAKIDAIVDKSEAADESSKRALHRFDAQLNEDASIDVLWMTVGDKLLVTRNAIAASLRQARKAPLTRGALVSMVALTLAPLGKLSERVPAMKPLYDELAKKLLRKANGKSLPKPKSSTNKPKPGRRKNKSEAKGNSTPAAKPKKEGQPSETSEDADGAGDDPTEE